MVQFNFSERTIKAKVVYYGPPQSGKTTNLEQIHRISDPAGRNRLISERIQVFAPPARDRRNAERRDAERRGGERRREDAAG